MAIKVLELHHHGIRIGPTPEAKKKAHDFYNGVLGLSPDLGRPHIPAIDGYWIDVGGGAQIHLMGVEGESALAQGPGKDPSRPHVALAVEDIQAAKQELDRMGVSYWVGRNIVGPASEQVFMDDPFGNLIELHQAGTCRCIGKTRPAAAASKMS
jgi:catechol 2,3-dioxygenase-like lactoylglutathione lyase family enzyme